MLLYFCKSKMKNFPNVLFYFTLIPMISANIVTLKDIRLMQDVQNDCDFNGKLIRAVVGLSNPSTRVASGYNGDLYGICGENVNTISKPAYHFSDLKYLYHPDSKTYDVTHFASGVTIDVMQALAKACNFTLQVHLREVIFFFQNLIICVFHGKSSTKIPGQKMGHHKSIKWNFAICNWNV